jgi:hypothetical protein
MRVAISFLLIVLITPFFSGCSKSGEKSAGNTIPPPPPTQDFIKYTIRKGQQYCDQNAFTIVEYKELKFIVKFDNSAVYQTVDPANQDDINKLYGFSDNNSAHQDYSARFGWNWSRDSLRLFAYVYNNGIRDSKEIGAILTNTEYNCSIEVIDSSYTFKLNDKIVVMPRSGTTAKAEGYRLYPYFGGDETAPHDIAIWIREF